MGTDYSRMEEIELCEEVRRRYGEDVNLNDKEFLYSALEQDDGLLHALLYKMARA